MTMHSRDIDKFDPRHSALELNVASGETVKELLHTEITDDFVTALSFMSPKMALAWADCIAKCRRHNLKKREDMYWLKAKALCGVDSKRANLAAQVMAKIMVAEHFGGKSSNNGHHPDEGNK